MNALTGFSLTGAGFTEAGEVLERDGAVCVLLIDEERITARRAYSCLVEPEPGDVVLVARRPGAAHVLAVLERPGAAALHLALPAGSRITAEDGRLDLAAGTLVVQAKQGEVAVGELALTGTKVEARFGKVQLLADAIESIAQRVIGRFRRSYRLIEETEQVRARDIDQRASGHLHLKGDVATIQAGAVVKVDGHQIHLG